MVTVDGYLAPRRTDGIILGAKTNSKKDLHNFE